MKSRVTYFCNILTVVLMLTLSCKIISTYGDDMLITEAKAIELANKEAKRLGYNTESMQVKATHYNTPMNEYLSGSDEEYSVVRRNKLKNKEYWSLYYYNPKFKKGGDFCIFIDSRNGAVITDIRGK